MAMSNSRQSGHFARIQLNEIFFAAGEGETPQEECCEQGCRSRQLGNDELLDSLWEDTLVCVRICFLCKGQNL
jgi:hypothetical protein